VNVIQGHIRCGIGANWPSSQALGWKNRRVTLGNIPNVLSQQLIFWVDESKFVHPLPITNAQKTFHTAIPKQRPTT